MDNCGIIRTALQLGGGTESDGSYVHPYHLLGGYVKLLSTDEAGLRVMLGDSLNNDDLDACREFFREKKLDLKLMKIGLPLVMQYLSDFSEDEKNCRELVDRILSQQETMSSRELLVKILQGEEEMLSHFAEGRSAADVFSYAEELKQNHRAKQEAASAGSGNAPETGENGGSEAAGSAEGKTAGSEPTDGQKADSHGETSANEAEKELTGKERFEKLTQLARSLRVSLLSEVMGQEEPIREFVQGCYQGTVLASSGKREKPKAAFLFVGPPGVGKTLLAQTAAKSLGYPSLMLNMSEYSTHQSHEGLIGISGFYNNAQEGRLLKFVRENPKSILIFDEIEKAHRNVIQIFLQILDQGKVDNAFQRNTTSFKDTIIIFTSNACASIYEGSDEIIANTPKSVILSALRSEKNPDTGQPLFPAAICSRIASGNVIMFNHLGVRIMYKMVTGSFERIAESFHSEYGYSLSFDERIPLLFLFHYGNSLDARIASEQSEKFIKSELYEISRQQESHPALMDEIEQISLELDIDSANADPAIRDLFDVSGAFKIAVICRPEDRAVFTPQEKQEGDEILFVDSLKELEELLKDELTMVLVDPKCGMTDSSARGVSLDDYDAFGVHAFRMALESSSIAPVYLIETRDALMDTDRQTFFQQGAAGCINIDGATPASVQRQIRQYCETIRMEDKGREFSRQGYVLDYNSAQIPDGKTLRIQFHQLRKHQALDAESAQAFLSDAERPDVRFDDVIGAENAKEELQYYIRFLKNPAAFIKEGGKPAKGLLLYGPPGTGKTMLARAMAGESKISFIQTSASDFLSKWLGQSEENIRKVFKRAKQYAPAIIFIDEIDAIGKVRTGEAPGRESALNTLLTQLDGFEVDLKRPVFVIAATNYAVEAKGNGRMTLDPALVRRFDNRIYVDLPNEKERIQYLTLAVAKKQFDPVPESVIKNLAARTPGLSIAILQNVVDLAYRNAKREGRAAQGSDLMTALEEYNYGEKHDWGEEYCRSVAIHESGHAYLAWLSGEKPSYVTIVSRGDFGGYMAHENNEKKPNFTREELLWRIRCALAGRASEEVFFGREASLNTGASSDLVSATNCALRMICEFGMAEENLIALPFEKIAQTAMAAGYVQRASDLLRREMETTIGLLSKGKEAVQKLADELLKKNHLTGEEILALLEESEGGQQPER